MLEVIRDVHDETGLAIGMKPAGGIRTAKQAIQYLCVLHETLGLDVADARPVPLRRLLAPQRRAPPAPQAAHRHLPVARRVHARLMGAVEKPAARRSPPAGRWDYASSHRGARHRVVRGALRALHRRGPGHAALALVVHDRLPSTEEPLAEVAQAGAKDVALAVDAAREAFEHWSALAARRARQGAVPNRADPPGTRPRARGRRVARRRQADQGVAGRRPAARRGALLLLRRLGRQARVRVPGTPAATARCRRADRALELPAPDAGLEDRAGARLRQHRRAEAGGDDSAHRAAVRRRVPAGGGASRRRQHRHGRRVDRRAPRAQRGDRQGRVHRLDRRGEGDPAGARGPGHRADARARRQGREHRVRRLRARPGRRGDRQRHLLQSGPRLLRRARGCSCRSRSTTSSSAS